MVHMPCGRLLETLRVAFFRSFAESNAESAIGTIQDGAQALGHLGRGFDPGETAACDDDGVARLGIRPLRERMDVRVELDRFIAKFVYWSSGNSLIHVGYSLLSC